MEPKINRVLQTWNSWDEKVSMLPTGVNSEKEFSRTLAQMKLAHFQSSANLLSVLARQDEKAFMPMLHSTIRKLERQVYPDPVLRLLKRLANNLVEKPKNIRQWHEQRHENIETLKGQLSRAGFGDFTGKLENKLDQDLSRQFIGLSSQFDPAHSLNLLLRFEKDAADRFQFRAVEATLRNTDDGRNVRSFEFRIGEWPGLTAQRVKNLLQGRAVKQDFPDVTGKIKSHWMDLSSGSDPEVRRYPESYGFDLQQQLATLPGEINYPEGKVQLLEKLEQGSRVQAEWSNQNGKEVTFLHADPAGSKILLTDSQGSAVGPEQLNEKITAQLQQGQQVKQHQPLLHTKDRNHKTKNHLKAI